MTFADLIKSIIDSSKERIKSPIAGAYFLAFIIYNWRPILFLFFSDAGIVDKIVVINDVYCNEGAILWPAAIAIGYTLLIPYLSLGLEMLLSYSKRKRIENDYEDRAAEISCKIKNVEKELELQAKLSINKEKEQLILEIESLNKEVQQLKETNNIEKEKYQNQTDELNTLKKFTNKDSLNMEVHEIKLFNSIVKQLDSKEIEAISKIPNKVNAVIDPKNLNPSLKGKLKATHFINFNTDKDPVTLTELGSKFISYLENYLF